MSFKPNTTIYLCTGTGLDSANSIWAHRYAYSSGDKLQERKWWNTLFQWFKCHSIAEGYWYYTYTDPSKGYLRVGRTPLSDGSKGEPNLGRADKQVQLDGDELAYRDAISAVDWVVFANEDSGISDVQYCMVNSIEYINYNVAQINFTVDALLTYQKYFNLGRCFVERDMQFNEWKPTSGDRKDQIPTLENINIQPDYTGGADSDYVFEKLAEDSVNADGLQKLDFGAYTELFCTTDVDLENIKSNAYANALPAFSPSESTKIGEVNLGIGIYRIRDRVNEAFTTLGGYNAMEHILSSYVLPKKVLNDATKPIEFVPDAHNIIKDEYKLGLNALIKFPPFFRDSKLTSFGNVSDGYKPINFKCYTAPISYFSVVDKQGSSIELQPQNLFPNLYTPNAESYFGVVADVDIVAANNVPSFLYIRNTLDNIGSRENPFLSLWQFNSYVMTPNNSGYYQTVADGAVKANASRTMMVNIGAIGLGLALIAAAPVSLPALAVTAVSAGAAIASKTAFSEGISAYRSGVETDEKSTEQLTIGLPKAVGGISGNITSYTMNNCGYEFYLCHLKTDLIKLADYTFSLIGYAQNAFRYPHINTRKRWCYVKLSTVNIHGVQANEYDKGGVPFWAREQIEKRLKSGITFWNLRKALNDNPVQKYTDISEDTIKMKFIKNYGNSVRSTEMLENADHDGDYANTYSDEADIGV